MSRIKKPLLLILILFVIILAYPSLAVALSAEQKKLLQSGVLYFDYHSTSQSCEIGENISFSANTDYAGRPILNDTQLKSIEANRSFYEISSSKYDVPWQLLAVIHLREFGLKKENPANGQGVYQFVDKRGGPYPAGPIDDEEFQRQTDFAAEFLQQKASGSNLEINKGLSASSSPEVIKDTLFSYNGRSSKYAEQAKALGFDKQTQPYEGSPYVMNKADALRDPEVNTTSWGQVKVDFGPIEYPANDGYGAYVIFASIAGIANGCGSSDLIWPYSDRVSITSCYGPRTHPKTGIRGFHKGVDMSAGEGTPIRAAAAGTVVKAGQARGYGANFVVIEHGNGFGTSYGHMGAMTVKEGDRVNQGQKIGTEGNEGISTGSHLHFNLFPGKYAGNDSANLNPLQNGFSIPEGTINAPKCS